MYFSDTLTLIYNNEKVPLHRTGIAWPSDKNIKYQNPPGNLKEGITFYYLTIHYDLSTLYYNV